MRESGAKTVSDVWHLVEKETNYQFEYGSGRPLYKCKLLRIHSGYIVMNIYHHGAADGTSGLLMLGNIFKQYKMLEAGQDVQLDPHKPRGPMEELTKGQLARQDRSGHNAVIEELIKEKVRIVNLIV